MGVIHPRCLRGLQGPEIANGDGGLGTTIEKMSTALHSPNWSIQRFVNEKPVTCREGLQDDKVEEAIVSCINERAC